MKKKYYVFASAFFFSMGGNILSFSLVYRLTDRFSFTPGQVGRYMALAQIFYFLGLNLYRRFGSAFNPLKVFSVSSLVVFLASLPLGYTGSRGVIHVFYWILQMGTGFFWPPVMAHLTGGLSGKELTREIGNFNRCWMSGIIVGPLVAGILYQWNSVANFAVLNASYFLVPLFLLLLRRSVPAPEAGGAVPAARAGVSAASAQASSAPASAPEFQAAREKLDLYRYRGWLNLFCSAVFVGILVNIFPLHIRDGIGSSESQAGMMLFLRSVSGFAGFTVLAKVAAWHFKRRWFLLVQAGLILCALVFLAAGNNLSVYTAVILFYGFVYAGCYNNSIFYSGATGKDTKKNLAVHEISSSVGNIVGTAGGGFFYQHFGFAGLCLALVVFQSIALRLLFMINKKEAGPKNAP